MNKILIVAEHDGTRLNPAIAKCVRCARDIPDANVTVLVLAADPAAVAADAATINGVDAVVTVANPANAQALAATLAIARGCVANDSGAMHLAGAVGTPLVALFGPTRERETAPLTRSGGRAEVLTHPVWCRPCMLRECPIDHRCMRRIHAQTVFEAI